MQEINRKEGEYKTKFLQNIAGMFTLVK